MKISITKKQFNIFFQVLGAVIFFLAAGIIFFNYSIDISPLIFAFCLFLYAKFFRNIEVFSSPMDLYLLGALSIITSIIITVTFRIPGYGIPAIGFVILATLLFDSLEFSFLFSLFFFSLGASIEGGSLTVGTSLFAGALTSAVFSFRVHRRFEVIKAGLIGGVVQFLVALIIERVRNEQIFVPFFSYADVTLLKICLLNGVSSLFVLAILPIFEYIFRVVTNISLLELSDFNHPLLRKLILEAPGTYQHSLVVANLSEAAADAIGANSLLVRVGAYYHDIGKMIKPSYFVENIVGYKDMHKDLKPSMSKLIIINHVKDGVDLAKKYRLKKIIIDFIIEHHGKTLVYYFYQRAKELEPEKEHEENYRYVGPKPQSKETAIVALADTIEALSRTLEEPTPSRIEEMIREVIRKRFMEGELDESTLTLKDLEKITKKFAHVLNALFHTRINYPKEDDRNNKSTKDKENKS
ncbi:MAG: HDIG domain-containing protein [Candidatus Omnitrophota bacterium]|nr:HDIG domain-containing protein [Candidatus Omnitrophota bacterium]